LQNIIQFIENFQSGIKNFKMKKANAAATHIAKAPRANAPTKALSKSVSVQPKKDRPFCKNLNSNTHPSTDKNKLTITAELKRYNYLTDKNRQCITGGIFYCRDSAGFSVSASNKLLCNLTEQCFEIGNKNIPPIRYTAFYNDISRRNKRNSCFQ